MPIFFYSSNTGNFQADEFLTTVFKCNQVFLMAKNAQNSGTLDSLIFPLRSAIICHLFDNSFSRLAVFLYKVDPRQVYSTEL